MVEENMMTDGVAGLSKEELEIIDFINEKQIESEIQAKSAIKELVMHKYGKKGEEVFNLLEQEDEPTDEKIDCPDCGEAAGKWIEESQEKLELLNVFLDDELEAVAKKCIESELKRKKDVRSMIAQHRNILSEEVPDGDVTKVCQKILFIGISEGWLLDENFE
jgi:hypothetical protein